MALIKCSECSKEVSDKANACPSCGNPIHNQPVNAEEGKKPVEIVQTNKTWKKIYIFALVLLVWGLANIVNQGSTNFGILLIFLAFILIITARVGSWWTNG